MALVSSSHFGGNVILTRDSHSPESPFSQMSREIDFSHLRYPGGAVTENQTWENGGLARMFGKPLDPGDKNYVLTIRESLENAAITGQGLTIVIPTKQFYNHETDTFMTASFNKYIGELKTAILEFPAAKIEAFEIGNEYWGDGPGGSLTASEYGFVANAILPSLGSLKDAIVANSHGISHPDIGIQAGSQWRAEKDTHGKWHPTGSRESHEIAAEIDQHAKVLITKVYQHSYPDATKQLHWQLEWATDPMKVFLDLPGFSDSLKLSFSEFNIGSGSATGVDQGASWIEAFSAAIDSSVDEFMHWGLNYEWLANKFYDTKFPKSESEGGTLHAIATPMGQVYDLAETHLIGKSTISDAEAFAWMKAPKGLDVTGFSDSSQKVVFLHNDEADPATIGLTDATAGKHVSVFYLKDVDSPHTPGYDESIPSKLGDGEIADARGDMHVEAGNQPGEITLKPGEMGVVIISDPGRDLVLEGAHHATDASNGMVNDFIKGAEGNDILRGHVGDDTLSGAGGRDVLSGGEGDDRLLGGDDGDIIFAGKGNDTVHAGNGNDVVVVAGGEEGDLSVVNIGEGKDTVLIAAGQNVIIGDFSLEDTLGFDGAFADAGSLQDAMSVDGEDLVVALPDEGSLRIVDGASLRDELSDHVLDFQGEKEVEQFNDQTFDGLNSDQIDAFYESIGTVDGFQDFDVQFMAAASYGYDELGYWEGLDASLARLGDPPDGDDVPDNPDPDPAPEPPEEPHDDDDAAAPDEPPYDDDQNYSDASGGSCFVATAAYGDRLHPEVVALRAFRDIHLVKSKVGRGFIRWYWIVGPVLARRTRPHHLHARFVRFLISAVVARLKNRGLTGRSV